MKKIALTMAATTLASLASNAQSTQFLAKHLAVLRAGDGVVDLHLKQSPAFLDEFATGEFNTAPIVTVAIPTNGANTLFFNGHAATEGMLARSADHRVLSFAGYGGVNLLQMTGTPSMLDIKRGFCTVDASGNVQTTLYRKPGDEDDKMNPRGVVTDGANGFWGCGNALGTVYYNAANSSGMVEFGSIPNTRAIKIVNHALYATLNGPDGNANGWPAGIFSFTDAKGHPTPLPVSPETALKLVVPAHAPYVKIAGFDLNPEGTIAYMADTAAGIQKYVKTDGAWKFAYNFSIPQQIPAADNHEAGCFALAVDFSGPAPVIYATTTEGYDGCVNSNRVVQIVDTNATATITTVAQAGSTKVAFRGIDFTPEPAKP